MVITQLRWLTSRSAMSARQGSGGVAERAGPSQGLIRAGGVAADDISGDDDS